MSPKDQVGQTVEASFGPTGRTTQDKGETVSAVDTRLAGARAADNPVADLIARADRLRQSILKRAFEGRLVPQEPDDEPATEFLARIGVTWPAIGSARGAAKHKSRPRGDRATKEGDC